MLIKKYGLLSSTPRYQLMNERFRVYCFTICLCLFSANTVALIERSYTPQAIAIDFVGTWLLGLIPPLVVRYILVRRPLSRTKAGWVAVVFSFLFLALFRWVHIVNNFEPSAGFVWFFVFFVARWIMSGGKNKEQTNNRDDVLSASSPYQEDNQQPDDLTLIPAVENNNVTTRKAPSKKGRFLTLLLWFTQKRIAIISTALPISGLLMKIVSQMERLTLGGLVVTTIFIGGIVVCSYGFWYVVFGVWNYFIRGKKKNSNALTTPKIQPSKAAIPKTLEIVNQSDSEKEGSLGYIINHWQGNLPLSTSFGVNGAGLWLIVIFFSTLVDNIFYSASMEFYTRLVIIKGFIFLPVFFMWQVVGVFRSAGRTIEEQKKYFGATSAVLLTILFILGWGASISADFAQHRFNFHMGFNTTAGKIKYADSIVDESFSTYRIFESLKTYMPKTHSKLRDELRSLVLRGAKGNEITSATTSYLQKIAPQLMDMTSNRAAYLFIESTTNILNKLNALDNGSCVNFMRPQFTSNRNRGDLLDYADIISVFHAFDQIVIDAYEQQSPVIDLLDAGFLHNRIIKKLALGTNVSSSINSHSQYSCDETIAYYNRLLSYGDDKSGNLARALMKLNTQVKMH